MKVEIDGNDLDGFESLTVYLDDGTEIGCYCIVEDPERERASLEKMLRAVRAEALAEAAAVVEKEAATIGADDEPDDLLWTAECLGNIAAGIRALDEGSDE